MKSSPCLILGTCLVLQALPPGSLHSTAGAITLFGFADEQHDKDLIVMPNHRLDSARELFSSKFSDRDDEPADHALTLIKDFVDGREYTAFIMRRTKEFLPEAWKSQASRIAEVLIDESNRNHMDPLFLMALIEHESKFRPEAIGRHGEIGLMQIKPSTALNLIQSRQAVRLKNEPHSRISGMATEQPTIGLADLSEMLKEPSFNIRCGASYLAGLKLRFNNRHRLYLSAYNMGAFALRRHLKDNPEPRVYSDRIFSNYYELAMEFLQAHDDARATRVASLH